MRYCVKRVTINGVGWQYNQMRHMWEMYYNGKVKPSFAIHTMAVVTDFINYNW